MQAEPHDSLKIPVNGTGTLSRYRLYGIFHEHSLKAMRSCIQRPTYALSDVAVQTVFFEVSMVILLEWNPCKEGNASASKSCYTPLFTTKIFQAGASPAPSCQMPSLGLQARMQRGTAGP